MLEMFLLNIMFRMLQHPFIQGTFPPGQGGYNAKHLFYLLSRLYTNLYSCYKL